MSGWAVAASIPGAPSAFLLRGHLFEVFTTWVQRGGWHTHWVLLVSLLLLSSSCCPQNTVWVHAGPPSPAPPVVPVPGSRCLTSAGVLLAGSRNTAAVTLYFTARIVTSVVFVDVILGVFLWLILGDELLSLSFYLLRTPFISFLKIRQTNGSIHVGC